MFGDRSTGPAKSFVTQIANMELSSGDIDILRQQLGREPHGACEIMRRRKSGEPVVIRVAPIVENIPFPTMYWLSDPQWSAGISKLESIGVTAEIQTEFDANPDLLKQLQTDHERHRDERERWVDQQARARLLQLNCLDDFLSKGIGGVSNFGRVRCLHAFWADHLVRPNSVGNWLEQYFAQQDFYLGQWMDALE